MKKMTPKQLANLKSWKKGQSGNPRGLNNPHLVQLRRLTAFELQELGSLFARQDKKALQKILKAPDGDETIFRRMIARMALDAMDGDIKTRDAFLDRVVGPISNKLQIFGPDDDVSKSDNMTDEQRKAVIVQNLKDLKMEDEE